MRSDPRGRLLERCARALHTFGPFREAQSLSAMINDVPLESWDPRVWEDHAVGLLVQHFGVDCVVRIPDDAGGDGGLDAYTIGGLGYQCYAPEGEPLSPSKRAILQKHKIGTDLAKLRTNKVKIGELLGGTELHCWALLTPVHKAPDVIPYCNDKAAEVRDWNMAFIANDFHVMVHDLQTFAAEHALLTHHMIYPDALTAPPPPKLPGIDFAKASGPQITTMDTKLAKVPGLKDVSARIGHRAALLEGQFLGDSLLDRFRTRMPDLATFFETKFEAARREMTLGAFASPGPTGFYVELRKSLVQRFQVDQMSRENAEHLANKCIADWLQQCPLDFVTIP